MLLSLALVRGPVAWASTPASSSLAPEGGSPPPFAEQAVHRLKLPEALSSELRTYHDDVEILRQTPSDDALCALVGRLPALEEKLETVTQKLDPESATVERDVQRLARSLPGLAIEKGPYSDGYVTHATRRRLAEMLPRDAPARALLEVACELDPELWVERHSDLAGCTQLTRASRAFAQLDRVWPRAPPCLQALVRPHLSGARPEHSACFCSSRAVAEQQLKTLRVHLASLQGIAPPGVATSLAEMLRAPATQFDCAEGLELADGLGELGESF